MSSARELFWPSLYSRLVPHRYYRSSVALVATDVPFLTDFDTLRQMIERDLMELLNATGLEAVLAAQKSNDPPIVNPEETIQFLDRSQLPLDPFPNVKRSILNYGLPSIIGAAVYKLRVADLEDEIRSAILAFEPRLRPDTLKVTVTVDEEQGVVSPNEPIGFEILAEVLGTPEDLIVRINTVWDLNRAGNNVRVAG